MQDAQVIKRIQTKYRSLRPEMDERLRRQWAAAKARDVGWGGITAAARPPGMSRTTITAGFHELTLPEEERVSRGESRPATGGGRKSVTEADPGLLAALESLVEPVTRGDPESPLRWTCKSTRVLAEELDAAKPSRRGADGRHAVAQGGVQLAGKPQDAGGIDHPDRNAQFEYINAQRRACFDT